MASVGALSIVIDRRDGRASRCRTFENDGAFSNLVSDAGVGRASNDYRDGRCNLGVRHEDLEIRFHQSNRSGRKRHKIGIRRRVGRDRARSQ